MEFWKIPNYDFMLWEANFVLRTEYQRIWFIFSIQNEKYGEKITIRFIKSLKFCDLDRVWNAFWLMRNMNWWIHDEPHTSHRKLIGLEKFDIVIRMKPSSHWLCQTARRLQRTFNVFRTFFSNFKNNSMFRLKLLWQQLCVLFHGQFFT